MRILPVVQRFSAERQLNHLQDAWKVFQPLPTRTPGQKWPVSFMA